ncbi:alpha/beta hydrolase [candidate division WWE3 bacterium]|uniref:Alpha/beta hydrolase n=1 Tax=candidate division WWE3 bacterium TaxID=2053526 RepID=A0A955RQB5_UNCKA|nr:alpha/beta hydrolase [candidate division WWE3 bacterium]
MKVVVLHGWGGHAPEKMKMLVSELKAKGHEVFAPSLPGFGEAEPPQEPWGVSDYVVWVDQQVRSLGWEHFSLCGHSFGGRISIKYAIEYPSKVDKLILIASAGIKHELNFKTKLIKAIGTIGKSVFSIPGLSLLSPIIHKLWRILLGRKDYYRASGVMQQTFIKVIEEDLRGLVSEIKIPTLILWGKKDAMVPIGDAHFLHENISDSKLKIYSQGDHLIPYNYPEEIAEEIDQFIV